MSLDLAFDDGQQAIAEAVRLFCVDRCDDDVVKAASGALPRALWCELAELGVLAVGTPEADGGALEAVAAVESLGWAAFPGPLAATFLATNVALSHSTGMHTTPTGLLPLDPEHGPERGFC